MTPEPQPLLTRFLNQFNNDNSYLLLACYAALPLVLTPELLNYLHSRFLRGRVKWEAQADLLLSELCQPVGYELYAMSPDLRNYLLVEMEKREGLQNMQAVAHLLLSYVYQLAQIPSGLSDSERQAQRWAAMAYLKEERENVVTELEKRFQGAALNQSNSAEKIWLSRLVDTLKPQLQESQRYPSLVKYAKMVRDLLSIPVKVFEFDTVTVDAYGKTIEETIDRPRRQAYYYTEPLAQGVTLEMFYIPAGTFLMGSPDTEKGRSADEGPQHSVTVASFWMGKYPITQAQWEAVMGDNPSHFKGKNRPVEWVSWEMATEFCEKLSKLTGKTYRLPSEAQWEYACRAGTKTPFYCGETITLELANYNGNYPYGKGPKGVYRKETTEVGSFPPNAFGLYDMSGNVWEWCADVWHDNYKGAPTDGSAWVEAVENPCLLRGGSWSYSAVWCRAAPRLRLTPDSRAYDVGLRVVLCAVWTP